MCRRVQLTHTDSDDLFKFAKEHARKIHLWSNW